MSDAVNHSNVYSELERGCRNDRRWNRFVLDDSLDVLSQALGETAVVRPKLIGDGLLLTKPSQGVSIDFDVGPSVSKNEVCLTSEDLEQIPGDLQWTFIFLT